jgi:DHA1 family tetracycline resistance protein-like MFS transporter
VVKRFGERATLVAGLLFGVAGFAAFGLAATGAAFWAGIPLLALWGIASAALLGLMSREVGSGEQGALQGANASIMGIANLVGPALFAQTLASSITHADLPGLAFLLAALLLLVALALAWWTTRATTRMS